MLSIITNCWALFLGMGLIMLGNGLQGTLLGVRASIEGFSTTITGLVMSGYFMGLVLGCISVPKIVGRVGHIRTFGALASLASTAILVQAVFVEPLTWWIMRLVTGFAYSGLYIVAESWLNDAADNGARGKLLSFYMLVSLGGMAGGQMMLNISPPSSYELFVLVSLLVSLAVIPILLSVSRAPQFEHIESVSIIRLYRISPLGVFGTMMSGMTFGAFFGMGAVYATEIGMSVRNVSLFMGTLILGGFLFQYPLGWLSDTIGRTKVILFCCITGALASAYAVYFGGSGIELYALVSAVGGLSMPLYALFCVHTNDYLTPPQMVAASGTLVLLSAIGATIGSPATAFAMDMFGPQAFYGSICTMLTIITLFTLWRFAMTIPEKSDERGEFVVMASSPLSAALNPEVEMEDMEAAAAEDTDVMQSSFEELAEELKSSNE